LVKSTADRADWLEQFFGRLGWRGSWLKLALILGFGDSAVNIIMVWGVPWLLPMPDNTFILPPSFPEFWVRITWMILFPFSASILYLLNSHRTLSALRAGSDAKMLIDRAGKGRFQSIDQIRSAINSRWIIWFAATITLAYAILGPITGTSGSSTGVECDVATGLGTNIESGQGGPVAFYRVVLLYSAMGFVPMLPPVFLTMVFFFRLGWTAFKVIPSLRITENLVSSSVSLGPGLREIVRLIQSNVWLIAAFGILLAPPFSFEILARVNSDFCHVYQPAGTAFLLLLGVAVAAYFAAIALFYIFPVAVISYRLAVARRDRTRKLDLALGVAVNTAYDGLMRAGEGRWAGEDVDRARHIRDLRALARSEMASSAITFAQAAWTAVRLFLFQIIVGVLVTAIAAAFARVGPFS